MSAEAKRNPGTGLKDVYDLLLKAPSERLLSLTIQLGDSAEDTIVHALCLVILQREASALSKLQKLEDNSLACHLAEKWQTSQSQQEDFREHCGRFEALTGQSLASLARIFKVLTQQQLCDPFVRNLAYRRAISSDCQKTSTYDETCYDKFREEAKDVCGPEFVEWICSSAELNSEFYCSHRSLNEGMTTLKVTESESRSPSTHCLPSPLQASPSTLSFPSHLEISIPATVSFQGDRAASGPSSSHNSHPPSLSIRAEQPRKTPEPLRIFNSQPESATCSWDQAATSCTSEQASQLNDKRSLQTEVTRPNSKETHECKDVEEDEEDVFYAFVVLHAPEDVDLAGTMRDKLETVACCKGATFSEDFAVPGKSTLHCVEDAINNSAFTFLLLTRNFNSRMLNMKTNTALMNSINNEHKYNTVIPLLPKDNCLPRHSIPLVLQTIVPLEENKSFERKIQRSLSPAKIEKQRKKWTEEQRLKTRRLEMQRSHQSHQLMGPEQDGGDGRPWWSQSPNICIQNAKYIMIGNDSQMNVGLGESADAEDSVCTK